MPVKQNVTLKGSGDGYLLHLNDHAAYADIIEELDSLLIQLNEKKQTKENSEANRLMVTVQSGNRYLTESEKDEIKNKVEEKEYLKVKKFDAHVTETKKALEWHNQNQTTVEMLNVRNGQIISSPGHILVLGDIHPGGIVRAGRSVFVLGQLRGLAQAGCGGDDQSVIVANFNHNAQIRIAENVHIIDNKKVESTDVQKEDVSLQVAYMNDLHILEFTSLDKLQKLRPTLGNIIGRLD